MADREAVAEGMGVDLPQMLTRCAARLRGNSRLRFALARPRDSPAKEPATG